MKYFLKVLRGDAYPLKNWYQHPVPPPSPLGGMGKYIPIHRQKKECEMMPGGYLTGVGGAGAKYDEGAISTALCQS